MRHRLVRSFVAAVAIAACGSDAADSDSDDANADSPGASSTSAFSSEPTTTARSDPTPPFEPLEGMAIVEAGGERFEFIVFECLVGDAAPGPTRRLALSASDTEPFTEASIFLNVDILVSQVLEGHEEHVISIIQRYDPRDEAQREAADLGAADVSTPSRGGPATDDWIVVDEDAGIVHGTGFELRSTTPGFDTRLTDGILVADCD